MRPPFASLCLQAALFTAALFGPEVHLLGQAAHSPAFEVRAGIPIVIDPAEDPAIQAAAADLKRDLRKVLGADSQITGAVPTDSPAIIISCRGESTQSYRDGTLTANESYSIRNAGTGPLRIVLQGADTRGTIYSIYEFSDRALGVPPLWFWSGWQPHPSPKLPVSSDLFRRVAEPAIRWRGWFPNDTDMLKPWLTASSGNIDLFLETLLRLRFNVLDVDHISNWNDKPDIGLLLARGCRTRGIRVTFTHLAPFGFLLGDWDQYWLTVRHVSPPPKLLSNVAALDEFWTYAIHFVEDEHLDAIQSIEFRVDGDKPFWREFPDAPKDNAQRAQVISEMLHHQLQLLHKVSRGPIPLTRTVFYNEVGEFLDQGELKPPRDPQLIWNYASEQRDHFPRPEIFKPHTADQQFGYYFNLQFFTTGSHIVAGEGPVKASDNFRTVSSAVRPGSLQLVILNVGNVREFLMEITAASAMLWDQQVTPDEAVTTFCSRYFGQELASDARDVYRAYYTAYWKQKAPDLKGFDRQYIFHDLRYARAAEALLARIETKHYSSDPLFADPRMLRIDPAYSGASDEPHAIVNGTTVAAEKFQAATETAKTLNGKLTLQHAAFFDEAVESDAQFMLSANLFLRQIAQAYISVDSSMQSQQHLDNAAKYLVDMQAVIDSRGRPYLPGWYERETKFNLKEIGRRLEHARVALSQGSAAEQHSGASQ